MVVPSPNSKWTIDMGVKERCRVATHKSIYKKYIKEAIGGCGSRYKIDKIMGILLTALGKACLISRPNFLK